MGRRRVAEKWLARVERVRTPEDLARIARAEHKEARLLTDEEVQAIRDDLNCGTRVPVMLKYIHQLLADHDERVKREVALIELLEEYYEKQQAIWPLESK